MTIFCPTCDFLIQPLDRGGRLPPWCPHCGADLKRGAQQRVAATAAATAATRTKTASEIAAAFHRRRPAPVPAPQRNEAIKPAPPVPEPARSQEPAAVPRPTPPQPPARGETFADEQRRLDAALPLWCRLLRILFG